MSTKLRCSFCGKHQDEVKKLLAGEKAFICDECVAIAKKMVKEDASTSKPAKWPAPPKPPRR